MSNNINAQIDSLRFDKTITCIKPWTSLEETTLSGDYKPCCWINSILGTISKNSNDDIMKLWNNDKIIKIRKSFVNDTFHKYCPDDCPILVKREIQADSLDFYKYDHSEYETFSSEFRSNREKVISYISQKKIILDTFPLRLKMSPSNTCNLKCRMCFLDQELKEEIGENYYVNIYKMMPYLDELIILGGEPFACKVTKEIIFSEEIKKYPQIHFSTITNGTLLDDKIQEKLKGLRLGYFSFSLDSCNEKTFEQIRINASYSRTFTNLEKFIKKRDNGEIRIQDIYANITIQKSNYKEISEFVEFTNSLKIKSSFNFVLGLYELHDKIDEVRMSIEDGISKAKALKDESSLIELQCLLKTLPKYEEKIKKQYLYLRLLKFVNKKKAYSFLQKHTSLKKLLKRIVGL